MANPMPMLPPDGERHAYRARVAERQRSEPRAVDLEQGEVAGRIGSDPGRGQRPAIVQLHLDALRAVDHVMVREDIAVGADDDAGSEAALAARHRRPAAEAFAEEPAQLLRQLVVAGGTHHALGADRDHRRRYTADQVRVRGGRIQARHRDPSRGGRGVRVDGGVIGLPLQGRAGQQDSQPDRRQIAADGPEQGLR
jgi:hypothetical protein